MLIWPKDRVCRNGSRVNANAVPTPARANISGFGRRMRSRSTS